MYVRLNEPTCTVCIESPAARAGEGQVVALVALLELAALEPAPVLDWELVAECDVPPTVLEPDADGVVPAADPDVDDVEPCRVEDAVDSAFDPALDSDVFWLPVLVPVGLPCPVVPLEPQSVDSPNKTKAAVHASAARRETVCEFFIHATFLKAVALEMQAQGRTDQKISRSPSYALVSCCAAFL